MSKIISDASVKRSATATITSPSWRTANASPSSVATWTWLADPSPASSAAAIRAAPAFPQLSGSPLAASGWPSRSSTAQPRRSGDISLNRATAASAASPLGAWWALTLVTRQTYRRVARASLLAHRRRDLRDRRPDPGPQRVHGLLDRARRRRRLGGRQPARLTRCSAGPVGRGSPRGGIANRPLGLDVDQHVGVRDLRLDRVPQAMGHGMGMLEGGSGAKLNVKIDVVASPSAAGAELVVADHLRRPRGRDRRLDPIELLG